MRQLSAIQQIQLAYSYCRDIKNVYLFQSKSLESIRCYQLEQIKSIVKDAYEHVPYYRKKYKQAGINPYEINSFDDFCRIPTISKQDVLGHEEEFIDERFQKGDLIVSKTTGTSGQLLTLYLNPDLFITEELQVIRMIKSVCPEYKCTDKEVLVYTSEYPVKSVLGFYKVYYVNNLRPYKEIFDLIKAKKPTVIAIYPTILREVIRNIDFDFTKLGIKLIITNSEQSTQSQRDEFEKAFGCMVIDEFSSEENQSIAYQCKLKNYHEVPDCTYIELLNKGNDYPVELGELGEITGTCFLNKSMPLIRYRQGDLAERINSNCSCGCNFPIIGQPLGRKNDSFKTKNGSIVPSGRILDWSYSLILDHRIEIDGFQIIQESVDKIRFNVYSKNWHDNMSNTVKESFFDFYDDKSVTFEVCYTKNLPKIDPGKYRPIVSYVNTTN